MESRIRTPVFVISLDRAGGRRSRFAERARSAELQWEFFDAHEDLSPVLQYDPDDARLYFGRVLSKAELGVYSSHFTLWERLKSSEFDQCIIMEDDVIVDWRMIDMVARTDFTSEGIKLMKLYSKRPSRFVVRRRNFIKPRSYLVEFLDITFGAQGYVMTRKGAERLTEYCRNVRRAIDDQMDRYWDHGVLNLGLYPSPIIEEAVTSTIGDDRFTESSADLKRRTYLLKERWIRRAARLRRRLAGTIAD